MALLNHVEEAFSLVLFPFVDVAGGLSMSPESFLPNLPLIGKALDQCPSRNDTRPTGYHMSSRKRIQKRFILVGLGGSGKTEFCRKFAAQNQSR